MAHWGYIPVCNPFAKPQYSYPHRFDMAIIAEIISDQFDKAAWRFSEAITPVQTTLLWRLLDHDNSG